MMLNYALNSGNTKEIINQINAVAAPTWGFDIGYFTVTFLYVTIWVKNLSTLSNYLYEKVTLLL